MTIENILDKSVTQILSGSFLDYSMSVIVSRALPDVRDGLKPVHRRILFAMNELRNYPDKPYKKSARIVGDVIGKYHPHGDSAVYETMVRMAQNWSMRETLIDGHGNFGSMDGDSAAAMRYTEARLAKISMELLRDLHPEIVDYVDNYDGSEQEPSVLPARFPHLLVNGSEGIAVGMATKIAPHNLREVIKGVVAQIDNPNITVDELMEHIKGPDFPTGGLIMGENGIKDAFKTGKGSISLRGVAEIKSTKKKNSIVISEIPYQVNKEKLVSDIRKIQDDWDNYLKERTKKNSKAKPKGLDFASKDGVNDLSDRDNPVLIEIELKKDVDPELVLNHLYKHTSLQTSFSVNNLALVPKRLSNGESMLEPRILTLKETIHEYIKHQIDVTTRKLKFELRKKEELIHKIIGLIKALDKLDETIKIIRQSATRPQAQVSLMSYLSIDEIQADYILDMRLHKLTSGDQELERDKYKNLKDEIDEINRKLGDKDLILLDIKNDLFEIGERFGSERRSQICPPADDFNAEDLVVDDEVVVTITQNGFIKRTLESTYRTQRRKGIGVNGMQMYEDDFIRHLHVAKNKDTLLFFTNLGRVYQKKVYQVPESLPRTRGQNIKILLDLESNEKVQAVLAIREFSEEQHLMFVTKNGIAKKSKLSEYANIRKNGIYAITLKGKDLLIGVALTNGEKNITLVTKKGMSITFNEEQVKSVGRTGSGVKGIALGKDDGVVSFAIHEEDADILIATNEGYGKRTSLEEFRVQTRGGKGVIAIKLTDKNGKVIGTSVVQEQDTMMLITKSGTLMKVLVDEISQYSRNTQGTKIMNLRDADELQALARILDTDENEEFDEG